MKVEQLPLSSLRVACYNVRKTLENEEEETGVIDLANDIRENGLINPLTVRRTDENGCYEIVAGQRRFLALKMLNAANAPCNIIHVDEQKAEELSLIENVQRNQMTMFDKVRAYAKLNEVYGNIDKVASVVNVSKQTIAKYVKISTLPDNVLKRLDGKGDERIPLDVTVECAKLLTMKPDTDIEKALYELRTLTTNQKMHAIRTYALGNQNDIMELVDIRDNIALAVNNINLVDADKPYVLDEDDSVVYIPPELYKAVVAMVKDFKLCKEAKELL